LTLSAPVIKKNRVANGLMVVMTMPATIEREPFDGASFGST
jgi:hypothetical protein